MIEEIRKLLDSEKLLLGTDRTLKAMRSGTLKKIYIASNIDKKIKEDIEHYKEMSDFEILELKENNVDLGTICKKPFSISVIGLVK